jgi:hypothetical protein
MNRLIQNQSQIPCPPAPNKNQYYFDHTEHKWVPIRPVKRKLDDVYGVLDSLDLNK